MKIQVKITALGIIAMMASSIHARSMLSIYNYTPYPVTGTAKFSKPIGRKNREVFNSDVTIKGATPDAKGNIEPYQATMWEKSWGKYIGTITLTVAKSSTQNVHLKWPLKKDPSFRGENRKVWFEVREDSSGKLYLTYSKAATEDKIVAREE